MKAVDKSENNHTAKLARHAIAKSPLDISGLQISCSNGNFIQLTGQVRTPVGYTGTLNIRQEIENLKTQILAVHGIREVNGDMVRFG